VGEEYEQSMIKKKETAEKGRPRMLTETRELRKRRKTACLSHRGIDKKKGTGRRWLWIGKKVSKRQAEQTASGNGQYSPKEEKGRGPRTNLCQPRLSLSTKKTKRNI